MFSLFLTFVASAHAQDQACSCVPPAFTVPPDGYEAMPTNGRLWVREPEIDRDSPVLERADGGPVPVRVSLAADDAVLVSPTSPLEPDCGYTLRWTAREGARQGQLGFTTGEGPDIDPPLLIDAEMDDEALSGDCPLHVGARAAIDAADRASPSELLLAELEVVRDGGETEHFIVPASYSAFGWSEDPSCIFAYAGAEPGDEVRTSVVILDLAGNRSARFGPASSRFADSGWIELVHMVGRGPALALSTAGLAVLLAGIVVWRRRSAANQASRDALKDEAALGRGAAIERARRGP
jgi:hypothetical protein